MEIPTLRQLLRSLGPLPAPRTSEKSLQELFLSGGWSEDCLDFAYKLNRISAGQTGYHFYGTKKGTRPRDSRKPNAEVSRQYSLCLLVLFVLPVVMQH